MIVIKLVSLANGFYHADAGRWLKSWDVNARDGQGEIVSTADKAEAARFATPGDAFRAWRATSTVRPLRPDGQPNRPLTAFTIEIVNEEL